MVVPGKCDVCRLRKVKCDEVQPKCGSCVKVDRECRYTYGKVSHFVIDQRIEANPLCSTNQERATSCDTARSESSAQPAVILTIRSTRDVSSSNGLFRTFASAPARKKVSRVEQMKKQTSRASSQCTTPDPEPSIVSRETRMASKFLIVAGHEDHYDNYLSVFGDFLCLIPSLLRRSEIVYMATSSLVNAMIAYNHRTDENMALMRKSNANVIREIRFMIAQHSRQKLSVDVILAIRVMFFVEVLSDPSSMGYIFHAIGLTALLNSITKGGTQLDELTRNVFYSSYPVSLFNDVMLETDCIFDNDNWLKCPPPTVENAPGGTEYAWQTVMMIGIRAARLARLTRHARKFPEDVSARIEAMSLAADLWSLQLEIWIQNLQETGLLDTLPTTELTMKDIVPFSLVFPSTRILSLLVQYWEQRILVCGCIQNLLSLPPLAICPAPCELQEAQHADIECAANLLMSFEQMLRMIKRCPVVQLRSIFPMEMAFGSYYRLEQREAGPPCDGGFNHLKVSMARSMQVKCLELQNIWMKPWYSDTCDRLEYRTLVALATLFSGGDILAPWKAQHQAGLAKGSGNAAEGEGEEDLLQAARASKP